MGHLDAVGDEAAPLLHVCDRVRLCMFRRNGKVLFHRKFDAWSVRVLDDQSIVHQPIEWFFDIGLRIATQWSETIDAVVLERQRRIRIPRGFCSQLLAIAENDRRCVRKLFDGLVTSGILP